MNNITEKQEQEVVSLYQQGKGLLYCSKKIFGVSNTGLIKKILKNNGIRPRNHYESILLLPQNNVKYKQDKNYFKKQSSNMAWLLGFIAADGCVSSTRNLISIVVAKRDKEILEKIKNELSLENPIKEFETKDGFESCSLKWTCQEHKKDLKEYGIIPNKTFTLQIPEKLNHKFFIDYLRGYFDGDGSVNFINVNGKKKYTALRWQVCSGNKAILEWFINTLEKDYSIPSVKIQTRLGKNPLFYFQYSTNATKKIFEILYAENSLSLKRKKEHFAYIIKNF